MKPVKLVVGNHMNVTQVARLQRSFYVKTHSRLTFKYAQR